MIDREQVLHVARLARLRLSDEEVERMSSELSTILDHIEKINELELDSVEPTSHVVEVEVTDGDRMIGLGTHERRVIDAGGPPMSP